MAEAVFPRAGSRARLLQRFERDLRAWLATPEGRFAAYCAEHDREKGELTYARRIAAAQAEG